MSPLLPTLITLTTALLTQSAPTIRPADPTLSSDRLVVQFTPRGAGVALARLPDYPAIVHQPEPYLLLSPAPTEPPGQASFATLQLQIDDPALTIDLAHPWTITQPQPASQPAGTAPADQDRSISFHTTASHQDTPLLALAKTYSLPPDSFDLAVQLRLENLTDAPLVVQLTHAGPLGIPREDARADCRSVYLARTRQAGLRVRRIRRAPTNATRTATLLHNNADQPIAWWAVANKYFAAILVPAEPAGLEQVLMHPPDGPSAGPFTTAWTTAKITLPPRQTATLKFWVYLGPLDRQLFTHQPRYTQLALDRLIDAQGSSCTFALLDRAMAWLLQTLAAISPRHNYGVAILLLVIVFRIVLGPLSRYGFRATARTQIASRKLRPKVKELKTQFADDRKRLNDETLKLYKAHGITPAAQLGGCLPILIQIPIWGALYSAINTTIDLRGAPFVLWINDLSGPDAVLRFAHPYQIPVLSTLAGPFASLNVLPILMACLTAAWQTLRNQSLDAANPKRRRSLAPLLAAALFILMLYNTPSGLNLYIAASVAINGLQRWQITKQLQETLLVDAPTEPQPSAEPQANAAPEPIPPTPPPPPERSHPQTERSPADSPPPPAS